MQRELQDFVNQGALAHRNASSHEEWAVLWGEVLKKHNLQNDSDLSSLVFTPEEDRDGPALKVIH